MEPIEFGLGDLPSDFSLEKYEQCAKWTVEEWWRALSYRYPVHLLAKQYPEDVIEEEDWTLDDRVEFLRDHAANFISNPLPEKRDDYRPFAYGADEPLIRDLTGRDYQDAPSTLKKWKEAINEAEYLRPSERADAIDGLRETPAWEIHREIDGFENVFRIEVDLAASDDDLLREFMAWLKRIRSEAEMSKIPRSFGPADFVKWHEKRLLPYLDLSLWAAMHGGHLSYSVIGHALFPDEPLRGPQMRAVEPMIQRTVKPQARALLHPEVCRVLGRQVVNEAREKP
ncbi:DUF6387 family protein [Caballeronia sp. INML2]|uniref:DUF6387 family protein n=1 Tax=Caballeronia sp. INML2 TaxID=2921748 RepID=UPI002027E463|nr:DUF6387 family protein [Caballeronia sp. INML2]